LLWSADGWLLAAVLWTAVRALRVDSELAWLTALWFTLGALGLVLLPRVLTPRSARVLRWALVGYASLQLPVMLWQAGQGQPSSGLIGGPRFAGALIAVAAPLAPWWIWPAFAGGLWFSQSYLAVVAAGVGMMVAKVPVALVRRLGLGILLTGTALLIGFSFVRPGPMWQTRLATWNLAWPTFWEHPWVGLGPGGWGTSLPIQQLQGSGLEIWIHAHSEPIEWVCETGLVGLLLLAGWLWACWPRFWASDMRGSLVALGVIAAWLHVFHYAALTPWFVLVVGLGLRKETL